ncbi:p53-induced death domain-containing protein 1-like [Branchiostoma floridae x Branchiostoma japonicum]
MAMSAVLTVKQIRNRAFLQPVTVTLPWMWRKYASKQQVNTTLMHFQPNRGWAVFSAHLQEPDHTVTFKTFHFQSFFLVQTLMNDAVHFVEKIWKGYAEDKVHLSIIPNSTTREITMLCTHKLQDQQEFFYITEEQLKHQFKQQVYMKSNEKIKAMITEETCDIEIEKYDIPRGGITFYFPPATANRYSLRLKKRDEASEKGVYEGSIQFDRVQADGHTSAGTMEEAINNALIYLRPRSEAVALTDGSLSSQGSVPAPIDPHDVAQNFEKVVKSVGTSWKELALKLGLSYEAVQVIDQNVKLKDDFDKCRDALYQWRQINGKKATLEVLKDALSQIDMNSVRDEL